MARPLFTQRDVEKAVSGVQKAGLTVARIEIDRATGRIIILPGTPSLEQGDDLDRELEEWRARNGDG